MAPLHAFTPRVRDWFSSAFAEPTAVQSQAWPAIATGEHTLISAPTGSGKTLAAFLWGIDRLAADPAAGRRSPHAPGLRLAAQGALLRHRAQPARAAARHRRRHRGRDPHGRHAAARAPGDAPPPAGHPHHHPGVALPHPHLAGARHARAGPVGDRGRDPRDRLHQARQPHRADARADGARWHEYQRIGLSATQNPLEEVGPVHGRTRGGRAPSSTRACASRWTCRSPCRSSRWSSPSSPPATWIRSTRSSGGESTRRSIWPAIYPQVLDLVRQHRSTIVFVNNRRMAERLALRLNELADVGDRPRAPRLAGPRGAHRRRGDAQGGRAALPGGDVVARARHRHGRGRPRAADRVAEVRRPRPAAHRPRRALGGRHLQGAHLPQVPRRPAGVRGRRQAHARGPHRADRGAAQRAGRPRPADRRDRRRLERGGADRSSTSCTRSSPATHSYAELLARAAGERPGHARRALPVGRVRRAAPADRVGPGRPGRSARARAPASSR